MIKLKQNAVVFWLGHAFLFCRFGFEFLFSGPKSYRDGPLDIVNSRELRMAIWWYFTPRATSTSFLNVLLWLHVIVRKSERGRVRLSFFLSLCFSKENNEKASYLKRPLFLLSVVRKGKHKMYCLSIRRERLLRSPLPELPWEAWYFGL